MNRFSASFVHLLGSACVVGLVFALVRMVWYPGRFFEAASGVNLMAILVLVDITLGPLITLIIYDPGKPSLKKDIVTVVILQVAFLLYGVWSICAARPVYIAFDEDRFFLVTANEVDPADQKKASYPAFQSQPLWGPQFVGTVLPDDPDMREKIRFGGMVGMGVWLLPQYFVPYGQSAAIVKGSAKPAKELGEAFKGLLDDDIPRLTTYEEKQRANGIKVRFVRLPTKKLMLYVAVDEATGAVVEIL